MPDSRDVIRRRLAAAGRQVRQQVTQRLRRWLPVDAARGSPPDHQAHLLADGRMCCEAHDRAFEERCRWLASPAPVREWLGTAQERYLQERLGGHARDYPGPPR
jgi:hypothetical protein